MSEKKSRKRHLAKTITWRALGSIDTMIIGWMISGNPLIGLSIGSAEVITKMVLYYIHERIWVRLSMPPGKRTLIKAITWRAIGTTDTMLLAWLLSGNPTVGLKVGGIEIFTKIALYYVHEELWSRTNFGK